MSNFDRVKKIARDGYATRALARANARAFRRIGGKVIEGGRRVGGLWGWSGTVRVDDNNKSVDGNFGCGRCAFTGAFITGTENGKPKGPGGICFRCNGKGWHHQADRARNLAHDMFAWAHL